VDSPRAGSFWSQSAVLIAANGVAAVFSAVYVSVTGRLLGPGGYANVAASLSLAQILLLFVGPLETGVSKFAADYHGGGERGRLATLTYGSLRRLALPLAVGLVAWLALAPLLRRELRYDSFAEVVMVPLYLVLSILACVPRGSQRGDHRFVGYGINQVVEAAVRLAGGAAAVTLGLGAAGALGGYALGMAAALALALWQLRDLRAVPRAPVDVGRIYAFSLPLFVVYFYFLFTMNLDVLVAKRALTAAEAGIYGGCSSLTRMLYLVATPVYQVLFSRVAALRARGLPTARLIGWVAGTVVVGLALAWLVPRLFGAEILTLIFGAEYAGGARVLQIQWLTTSVLVLQAVATFALLGGERTGGTWLLVLPCALLAGLLWRYHGTPTQIAFASLGAVASGLLVLGFLMVRGK
jgi:O-antigen/teichoic acid export membrane protein